MRERILLKLFIYFIGVLLGLYAIFLFVLPHVVNVNKYKNEIQSTVDSNTNLKIDFSDIKLVTSPNLSAGVKIKDLSIKYIDGSVLLTSKNSLVKINLPNLLLKSLKFDVISIDSPILNIDIVDSNKLKFSEELLPQNKGAVDESAAFPFVFSAKLPKVDLKDYLININDVNTHNSIKLNGTSFVADKGELNKKIRIKTTGEFLFNDEKNVNFDVKLDTFLPKIQLSEGEGCENFEFYNFVNPLVKISPKANIVSNLKIREKNGNINIKGDFDSENMSFIVSGQRLPDSYIRAKFYGKKSDIDSSLYASKDESLLVKSTINSGHSKKFEVRVKSDKIEFSTIQNLIESLSDAFGIPNELNKIKSYGYIKADFSFYTDFKKLHSNGFLNVCDGKFIHKYLSAKIDKVNANVDFSKDNVKINKASAFFNGNEMKLKGQINSDSTVNISLYINNLNLASLFNAFAPVQLTKSYTMRGGSLAINGVLKGKLNKLIPSITISLKNLSIKDKINNCILKNDDLELKALANSVDDYSGQIKLMNTSYKMNNYSSLITNKLVNLSFDSNQISVEPFQIIFNTSPINVTGSIKNYVKKPDINIDINGKLKSSDLIKFVSKSDRSLISYKGSLPLCINVKGKDNKINVNAQVLANSNNYFSPVTILKMQSKPSMVNVSAEMLGTTLILKDIGLYELQNGKTYNEKVINSVADSYKVAFLSGKIEHLDKKVPYISVLKFNLPAALAVSTPAIKNSKFNIKGNLNAKGFVSNPILSGNFNVTGLSLPEMLTSVQNIDLTFENKKINLKVDNVSLNGSNLNIDADAKLDFSQIFTINSMSIISTNFEVDKVMAALEKTNKIFPETKQSKNNQNIPVKIISGQGKFEKIKLGNALITDAVSDFKLSKNNLYLTDLNAKTYGGYIDGKVKYNLLNSQIVAVINGEKIDANPAVSAFAGIKDQLFGNLNFNANVKFKGDTYEKQIKSLTGTVKFHIHSGQLGSLGELETFLKADNMLSQRFISTSIGKVISAIAPYNTGKFDKLSGVISFNSGKANISSIKSNGENMSLFINGTYDILANYANLELYGRLSQDIVNLLGPVATFSPQKIISSVPKYGASISNIFSLYITQANLSQLTQVPPLSSVNDNTQIFKVVLNGKVDSPALVKSFMWVTTASNMQKTQSSIKEMFKLSIPKAATTTSIPKTKDEAVQQVIQSDKMQEHLQKIQQNDKVQRIQQFGSLMKQYAEQPQQ